MAYTRAGNLVLSFLGMGFAAVPVNLAVLDKAGSATTWDATQGERAGSHLPLESRGQRHRDPPELSDFLSGGCEGGGRIRSMGLRGSCVKCFAVFQIQGLSVLTYCCCRLVFAYRSNNRTAVAGRREPHAMITQCSTEYGV